MRNSDRSFRNRFRTSAISLAAAGVLSALSLAAAVPAFAQPTTTSTSTRPADAAPMRGRITGIDGTVHIRTGGETSPWRTAAVGMEVDEGAEFRTGLRSAVRVQIPPDQTITLDRLGTFTLLDAYRAGNAVKTDIGMQYGRVRYDIDQAGEQHDSTIHSPGATLAVRGTYVSMLNEGFYPPRAVSLTGVGRFTSNGKTSTVGEKGGSKASIEQGSASSAQTALSATIINPIPSGAQSGTEKQAFAQAPSSPPGTSSKDQVQVSNGVVQAANAPVVAPPPPPPDNTGKGILTIALAWNIYTAKGGPTTSDLDLVVTTPLGHVISAKGTMQADGGTISKDAVATRASAVSEVVTFTHGFPLGVYNVQVRFVNGLSAVYGLAVLQNGVIQGQSTGGTLNPKDNPISIDYDIKRTATQGGTTGVTGAASKRKK